MIGLERPLHVRRMLYLHRSFGPFLMAHPNAGCVGNNASHPGQQVFWAAPGCQLAMSHMCQARRPKPATAEGDPFDIMAWHPN